MPKWPFYAVAVTGLIAALTVFRSASESPQEKSPSAATPPPPRVSVVTLVPENIELTAELPGRTNAYRTAEVRPQVNGIVTRRLFTEGQQVSENQPLYQIDASLWQAEVKQRQAELARAQAQAQTATQLLRRYNALRDRQVISQQDYENTASARNQARADVQAAEAALDTAKINLNYTQVRSPLSGIIGRSLITEGALVTAQQENAVATIQQIDPIYVDIVQSSSELLRLRQRLESGEIARSDETQAARVMLRLEDGSEYEHPGSLQFSEVTVDRSTGSVVIRAVVPNPDHKLLPGMFVRAYLAQGMAQNSLLIPQRGVTRDTQGQASVFVVNAQNQVEKRAITTSHTAGNRWLVTQGVRQGDRIVVEGMQKVRPGMKVESEEWQPGKALVVQSKAETKVASNG